jgi:prepilin-type N-terminal cleavage/methylation domain-containing protein
MSSAHTFFPPFVRGGQGGCRACRSKFRIPNSEFRNQPRAFTLVEILVVITILVLVSSFAFAVFHVGRSSERTRSAARIAQSALAAAKDRALHAKDLRGVRLIRDLADPTLVTGFAYLAPLTNEIAGNLAGQPAQNDVAVTRPNLPGSSDATQVVISGAQGLAWFTQDKNGLWPAAALPIRIPAQTGAWYYLARQQTSPPYWGTLDASGILMLTLQTAYQGGNVWPPNANAIDPTDANASCEIQLGSDLLPFHQPIPLPSGVVIDLDNSSPNVAGLWPATSVPANIDLMYSPQGRISGPLAGLGPIHFLLNSLADASQNLSPIDPGNQGDKLILTLFPQSGLVATFPIDPTDLVNNQTGNPGPDGIADDLFHFAKAGSAAGQ